MPLGPASFGPGQPGHSSAAEECSDPCGSLLPLQLDTAPTCFHSISFVGRDTLLIHVCTAKRQSDFVLWGSK